jgi:DNA polymerase elongation subunit (family B)
MLQQIEELPYNDFIQMVKSGTISPYQLYNADIEYPQYFAKEHYLQFPDDNIDMQMPLNICMYDIEVYTSNAGEFTKAQEARFPISAITLRFTMSNKYIAFFMLNARNVNRFPIDDIPGLIQQFKEELIKEGYIDDDEELEIHLFNNELTMLKSVWNTIHTHDPAVISGWFSSEFDTPYNYHRLCNLTGDEKGFEAAQIMSKFGVVKKTKMKNVLLIKIADYIDMDLLYLYKPRDDGGLNYGKKQASYALDWVAEKVLGLKKFGYKDSGMTLDTFYEKDPVHYLLYNITDVILIKKLNDKLKHADAHNMLRRLMKTPIGASMRGPAMLFDTMTLYNLSKEGKYTRYGLVQESTQSIDAKRIDRIPKPKDKSVKWSITDVTEQQYRAIMSRYPGAYVKEGLGKVVSLKDGITIDMDATALYPSMMLQYNISFDSIFGRIIDPICYEFLNIINGYIGKATPIPPQMYAKFLELAKAYAGKIGAQNKGDYTQYVYYMLSYLIEQLVKKGVTLDKLMNPQIRDHYVYLKLYLLPLIDLLTEVHDRAEEFNTFCHDYILNGQTNIRHVFVVEDINEPSIKISRVLVSEFQDYLVKNNISVNIAGTLLYQHDYKLGIFAGFLNDILALRKEYKKTRDSFDPASDEYAFYDMRQFSTKIVANTTYGLMGQATFRYSDKWVAKTITTTGRLTLKISQICGEIYLKHQKTA